MTTTKTPDSSPLYVRCAGLHHKDFAEIVIHDLCAARVAKREDGKLFDTRISYSYGATESYTCWNSIHKCNPEMVARVALEKVAKLAAGELIKGATVEVVKGRKVPKGTTGVVFWIGEDSYGKERIGFKDADGVTHWTASSNVEVR